MERWERLLEDLRKEFLLREDELRLLHEIDAQLLETERPLNTTFEFIVQRTQELLRCDHTHILLRRGRSLQPIYSTKESDLGQYIDLNESLTGKSLLSASTINIDDVTAAPYASRYIPIQGYTGPPMRSLLATPIKVHDIMAGVLNAESTTVGAFNEVHERIIAAIAAQVSMALQRAQLFDRNKLFSEVDQLIFANNESHGVISAALQKVMEALQELEHVPLTGAQILFRRGRDELEIVHSTKPSDVGLAFKIDESICGRAVRQHRTIVIGDVSRDPEYYRILGPSIQSEIAIPILLDDGNVAIGVLNVESEEPDAFQGFYQVILDSFAEKVRTLLAFVKLRGDLIEAMEVRNANDLFVAVGDQASNIIHRMNNTVGMLRLRIIELQELEQAGQFGTDAFLSESLVVLRNLAEQTLKMPDQLTHFLSQQGNTVNINEVILLELDRFNMPDVVSLSLNLEPDIPNLSLFNFDIVIQNLIQNALDAMPAGGTLSISTASVAPRGLPTGYVELIVRDTGTGIPSEVLPKIFELNFSTKHTKGKGLGLGLWWIRNFVRRAKGDIAVTSSVNEGSEFVVKIPLELPSISQLRLSFPGWSAWLCRLSRIC